MSVASKMVYVDRCCAGCWDGRHKCNGPGSGRCQRCSSHLLRRGILDHSTIAHANPLDISALSKQLFQMSRHEQSCLDKWGEKSSTLNLFIQPSQGPAIQFSHDFSSSFALNNESVISSLDGLARRLSADLKAKEGKCHLISTSALVGGYLHLICSVVRVTERIDTPQHAFQGSNNHNGSNIDAEFKHLLICRVQVLMEEILGANRLEDLETKHTYQSSSAYAAATVLRHELKYFKTRILRGGLREAVFTGFKPLLFDWLDSIDQELLDRVREGCGRFPTWRSSVIEGSMKKVNRHGETLTLDIHLRSEKWTMPLTMKEPDIVFPFENIEVEEDIVTSPELMGTPNMVVSNYFDEMTLLDSQFGEMESAISSPIHDLPPQLPSGFSGAMNSTPDGYHEFQYPGTHATTAEIPEEAIYDPRYLSFTDWYPGNPNV